MADLSDLGLPDTKPIETTDVPPTTSEDTPTMALDKGYAAARAAGYSSSDVQTYLENGRADALKAGYTDADVDKFLGYQDPKRPLYGLKPQPELMTTPDADAMAVNTSLANLAKETPGAIAQAYKDFNDGARMSSGGLLAYGNLSPDEIQSMAADQATQNRASHIFQLAGGAAGDFPAMVVGAVAGGAVGAATGNPIAAAAGAGYGTGALPQYIRSAYADYLQNGSYKSAADFADRTVATLWQATKAGAATAVGGVAGAAIAPIVSPAVKLAVEGVSMVAASSAIERQLPTSQDFIDTAVQMLAMHGIGHASDLVGTIKQNLVNTYMRTGQTPEQQLSAAQTDPSVLQGAMSPQTVVPQPGASTTPSGPDGSLVLNNPKPPEIAHTPADVSDELLNTVAKLETGTLEDPDAAVSKSGAIGKYQIEPATAKQYGFDPDMLHNGQVNETAARAILSDLSKRFNGDTDAILIGYNAGPGMAEKWLASGRDNSTLPEEAQKYLANAHKAGITVRTVEPHAGAGAATPGQNDATAKEYVPPTAEEASKMIGATIEDDETPPIGDRISDAVQKEYRDMLRPDDPLNRIQYAAESGRPIADIDNPKFLRRLAELSESRARVGIEGDSHDLTGNVLGPGLKEIIAPLKTDTAGQAFEIYAKAKWALEKAGQSKETGVAYDAAKAVVNRDDAKFGDMFGKLVNFRNTSAGFLRDSGIISAHSYHSMVDANKSSVPGYRVDDEREINARSGLGANLKATNPIKEMLGSESNTKPVLKSIIQDHMARMEMAQNNLHNVKAADMTRSLGLSELKPSKLTHIALSDAEIRKIGADPDEAKDFYRKAGADVGPNDVVIWRDGKPEVEHFHDPEIAEIFRGLPAAPKSLAFRMIAGMNRVFRSGVALNPLFPIRLLMYDVPFRSVVDPGFKSLIEAPRAAWYGLGAVLGKGDEYQSWLRSGGSDHVFEVISRDKYVQDVLKGAYKESLLATTYNAITTPGKWLQAWGRNVTNIMPAGRYVAGRRAGESGIRAAAASSEFKLHRPGYGGPQGKFLNMLNPFLLAHMNGLEQTLRGQLGKSENVLGERGDWKSFTVKAVGLITAPMLANWAVNKDKDWYKAAPDWQKNNGLMFNVGSDAKPTVVYLPFPPLLGVLYGGIPRMLADRFSGANPHAMDHLFQTAAGSVLPPGLGLMGGVVQTAIETVTNHSFMTGRPIVSDDAQKRLPDWQAVPWSSGTARTISRGLTTIGLDSNSTSPPMIDHAIQGLFGTLGKEVTTGIDMATGAGNFAAGRPSWQWADLPGISSFTTRFPTASSTVVNTFMDSSAKLDATHQSITEALKEGKVDDAISLLKQPGSLVHAITLRGATGRQVASALTPEQRDQWSKALVQVTQGRTPQQITDAQKVAATGKQLTQLRQYAKDIYGAAGMSPTDKRQNLDHLYRDMQHLASDGQVALDRLR